MDRAEQKIRKRLAQRTSLRKNMQQVGPLPQHAEVSARQCQGMCIRAHLLPSHTFAIAWSAGCALIRVIRGFFLPFFPPFP